MWRIFIELKFIIVGFIVLNCGSAQELYSEADRSQALICKTNNFLDSTSQCTQIGAYPILGSCVSYIQCYQAYGRQKLDSIEMECSSAQGFDIQLQKCVEIGSWNLDTEGCIQKRCQSALDRNGNGARAHRQYYGNKGYGNRFPEPSTTPSTFLPDCPPESVEEEPEFGRNSFYDQKAQNLNCNPVQGRYDKGRPIPPPPPPPPPPQPKIPQYGQYPRFPTQERATLGYNDPRYRFPTTTTEPPIIWPSNPPTRAPFEPPQTTPPIYQRPTNWRTTTTKEPEVYRPVIETQRPYVNNNPPPRRPGPATTEVSYQEPEYKPAVVTQRPYVNKSPPRRPDSEPPQKDQPVTTEQYQQEREPMTTKKYAEVPRPDQPHQKQPPKPEPETTTTPQPEEEAQNPADEDYEDRSPVSSEQGAEAGVSKLISINVVTIAIMVMTFLMV